MRVSLIAFLLVVCANGLRAQNQVNYWMGGQNAMIKFDADTALYLYRPDPQLFWRTTASISDSSGNLLFYTNGYKIFDKNFQVMQNGNNLNIGDYVSFGYDLLALGDGACIVPLPGVNGKYYVFHNDMNFTDVPEGAGGLWPSNIFYCLIDMSLAGGNGSVVAGQKDISILSDTLTRMGMKAVRHGNGRDWWLFCHEYGSNRYYRFIIDPSGIHGPYEQSIGGALLSYDSYSKSNLIISNDGSKAAQFRTLPMQIDLYDFDRCTGQFYNLNTFTVNDSLYYIMGGAFSPSNRFLYVTANYWH